MANKKEIKGTIHELDAQLAKTFDEEKEKPKSKKQIDSIIKTFNKLKLFPEKATKVKKEEIVKKLKINNFDEQEIINQQEILKQTINFNRAIDRFKKKIETDIRAGKNVRKNEKILKGFEEVEIPISNEIRRALNIHKKRIFLRPKSTEDIRNRIKYYSGQDYSFLIIDRFSKPTLIPEKELEKLNQDDNIIVWALNRFRENVDTTYEKEKRKFATKDPKKWKLKKKAFSKIYKVLDHNLQIATNKKYNKKLVQRDETGKIVTDQSEYPVRLRIVSEMIVMSI